MYFTDSPSRSPSFDLLRPLLARWHVQLGAQLCALGAVLLSAPAWSQGAKPPIFVLNSLDATISVVDPVSLQELRRLPTGKEPHHLYLTPDEKSLMVANALADSLTLVDPKTGQIQRVMEGIADPYQLRFSPDMKWFVTAANRLNHVDIYRSTPRAGGGVDLTLAKRVSTSKTPSHINIDSKSTVAYVTMQDSDELIAIDLATQTPRWKVPVGKLPADVFLTPDRKQQHQGRQRHGERAHGRPQGSGCGTEIATQHAHAQKATVMLFEQGVPLGGRGQVDQGVEGHHAVG